MTLVEPAAAPSDAELIAQVRGGELDAYGVLFDRHRSAAYRLARQLARGPDADDLVSEAFAKVLSVLKSGRGPDLAFRAYLLTAVRRLHVDRIRAGQRVQPTDDLAEWDPGIPFQDPAVEGFERSAASRAFASLPERWQLVLWHLEVERQKPAEVGVLLGLSANSVSALAYRAREGLRQAYLSMHLADTAGESCRWTTEHLSAHVRGALSKRDAGKVEEHLHSCPRCTALYAELSEVNQNLRGLLAPLLLGGAAAAYLKSAGGVTAGSLVPVLGKLGEFLSVPAHALAAGGAAATATAVAAATIVGMTGQPDQPADASSGAEGSQVAVSTGPSSTERIATGPGGSSSSGSGKAERGSATTPTATGGFGGAGLGTSPDGRPTTVDPGAVTTSASSPTPGSTSATPTGAVTTSLPTSTDPTVTSPALPSPTVPPTTPPPTTLPSPTVPSTTLPSPTVPSPTIPTTPTVPASDLGVSLEAAPVAPGIAAVTALVSVTPPLTGNLTLTISLPAGSAVTWTPPAWECGYDTAAAVLSCTTLADPVPVPLVMQVTYDQSGQAAATVDAADNDDPDLTNNSTTVTLD